MMNGCPNGCMDERVEMETSYDDDIGEWEHHYNILKELDGAYFWHYDKDYCDELSFNSLVYIYDIEKYKIRRSWVERMKLKEGIWYRCRPIIDFDKNKLEGSEPTEINFCEICGIKLEKPVI